MKVDFSRESKLSTISHLRISRWGGENVGIIAFVWTGWNPIIKKGKEISRGSFCSLFQTWKGQPRKPSLPQKISRKKWLRALNNLFGNWSLSNPQDTESLLTNVNFTDYPEILTQGWDCVGQNKLLDLID